MKHTGKEQTKKQARPLGKQYLVPAIKRSFDVIDLLAQGILESRCRRFTARSTCRSAQPQQSYIPCRCWDISIKIHSRLDIPLGLKLYSFSRQLVDQLDLPGRCHGLLEQLAVETGFTSHIAVMRDGESMYVDRVPGSGLIQFSSYIGMRWALHASGVGKALLAFLPDEELTRTLKYLPLTKTHTLYDHFAIATGKATATVSPQRVCVGNLRRRRGRCLRSSTDHGTGRYCSGSH